MVEKKGKKKGYLGFEEMTDGYALMSDPEMAD